MKYIIFLILSIAIFPNIIIRDEDNYLSKKFKLNWEKQYLNNNIKDIHIILKKDVKEEPIIYATNYFNSEDVGGDNGTGVVVYFDMGRGWLQVVIGTKVENIYSDTDIKHNITDKVLKTTDSMELMVKVAIEQSIKILNGVVLQ